MTETKKYQIEKTASTTYLNNLDKVISGFVVQVRFTDFDEVHEIKVPDLSPNTVTAEIDNLLKDRVALSQLG